MADRIVGHASQWRRRHPVLNGLLCLAVAGPVAAAGVLSIALGSCHSGGGFCATEWDFRKNAIDGYGLGVVLVTVAATVAALGLGRRSRTAALVGLAFGAAALAVIFVEETTR